MGLNIAYICQFFPPEIGAPAARGYEMTRVWREQGHEVKVVTAFPNHPDGVVPDEYREPLERDGFMVEEIDGLEVYRSYIYATPNEGFVRRVYQHTTFMVSSVLQSLPKIGEVDVIVVSSPTFFPVLSAYAFSLELDCPFVFEVRDLWPGIFEELGVIENPIILGALEQLELFLYRQAAHVVTVTESFKEDISNRGIPADKITTITNGVDLGFFDPADRNGTNRDEELREEFGLGDKFVAAYIGTHGIAHGLESHIEAAGRLEHRDDIVFLFVGDGARKEDLEEMVERRGLENVVMVDKQPKERMPAFYNAADVCFVPLRDLPSFEKFIPSKIFEILGCGTPIIGSIRGEAREILEESAGALVVEPEDAVAVVGAVEEMADRSREECVSMGRAGRRYVEENFSREALACDYLKLLSAVAQPLQV